MGGSTMRTFAISRVWGLFLCGVMGVIAMSEAIGADEKKDPKDAKSYTEKVTAKQWTGSMFLEPVKDVPAFRSEVGGKTVIFTRPKSNGVTPKGSEITDA